MEEVSIFHIAPQGGGKIVAERKNSEARIRANNKYNEKAYDRINIAVPKGQKDTIKAHAEAQGESVNGFVNRAIDETMERDNAAPGAAGEAAEGE